MPIGIISNALAIVIGGIIGSIAGARLPAAFSEKMNLIFGVCSMGMGISTIVLMENLPAVVFSIILGTIFGLAIHLGDKINVLGRKMQQFISRFFPVKHSLTEEDEDGRMAMLLVIIVLFCASGTGIYGSLISGMNGDHSIIITKAILDLFTALIFACTLGPVVSIIALPQLVVFLTLFFCAELIFPLTTPVMIADFKACGGFIMLATGFNILKLRQFPLADMLPSMVIVMPVSWAWVNWIMPLVS